MPFEDYRYGSKSCDTILSEAGLLDSTNTHRREVPTMGRFDAHCPASRFAAVCETLRRRSLSAESVGFE